MSVVPWSRVHHTAACVAIVATGPSLKGVDLTMPDAVAVIAVNAAILHLPAPPRFWFTLDPSQNNRAIMQTAKDRPETEFYAAVPEELGSPDAATWWYRWELEERVHWLRWLRGPHPKGAKAGLSVDPAAIHCGNSAYGALGLAYLMGARRIALLGVDANSNRYAWNPNARCGDLQHVPWLFASARQQLQEAGVEVVVGSPESRVECWPRMAPRQALEWLEEA
jgi:hypothetical protein